MLTTHASALLLLLPLAMASCPCPNAPASAKVCGSNYVTYDSQCALDCAALPGLTSLHSGPCSHVQSMMKSVFNVSLPNTGNVNPRSSVRGAVDDLAKISVCLVQKCAASVFTCTCSATDAKCLAKCAVNCVCDCAGIAPGPADIDTVNQCMLNSKCDATLASCASSCGTSTDCAAKCQLDYYKCNCKCNGSLSLRPTLGLSIALLAVWMVKALTAAKQ